MTRRGIPALLTSALLAWAAPVAWSASTAWQTNTHGQVRLIADLEQASADGTILLGLQFKTIPGWHVYWKNAGDAGYPPKVDWTGSQGVSNFQWMWPAPNRYELPGDITAIGYEGEAVYPVRAVVHASGNVLHVLAKVSYLTCGQECVPYKYTFTLEIPVEKTEQRDNETAPLLDRWVGTIPVEANQTPLDIKARYLTSAQKAFIRLDVKAPAALPTNSVDVFFEKSDAVTMGKPVVSSKNGVLRLEVAVSTLSGGAPPSTLPIAFTITHLVLQGKTTAVNSTRTCKLERTSETPVVPTAAPIASPEMPSSSRSVPPSLWLLVGLAILGGVVLNVMPCVLPVLSIKLLGLLQHAGHERRVIVRDALASAAGIEVSFAALAAAVVVAKTAGRAVGWGVQFQEPLFVGGLAIIVLLFALNLWGVFEIQLPRMFSRLGATSADDEGLGSYFTSGLFATLLATPCSAPFLGTAMGFALAQSTGVIFLIFLAVGFGMASPYFLLATFPQAIGWMPRPGAWMLRVRTVLGFLLAATALWLLYILSRQLMGAAVIGFVVILMALAFLVWGRETLNASNRYTGAIRGVLVTMMIALCVGAFFTLNSAPRIAGAASAMSVGRLTWVPFSENALRDELKAGHSVFLDVTADWCFTCKVNEARVLGNADVVQALADSHAILMRADWTNHDPLIGDFLKKMGRAGIPFNAYYQPGRDPILFSEFLSKTRVLEVLKTPSPAEGGRGQG